MIRHLYQFLAILSIAAAFSTTTAPSNRNTVHKMQTNPNESITTTTLTKQILKPFQAATTTATLAFLLSTTIFTTSTQPAFAATKTKTPAPTTTTTTTTPAAVQISLDGIPPSSLQLDAKSLPVIGGIISGRYAMVDDSAMGPASINIQTPKSAIAALEGLTSGHLEVDLVGIVKGHLNVDIAAKAGEATVKVTSPLIPALPFKNSATATASTGSSVTASTDGVKGGKASDWSKVVNLGSGTTYYYNEKTEESQYKLPKNI